jgi:uncharacterized protein
MNKAEYKTPEELLILTDKFRPETVALIKELKKKKPKNLDDTVHQMHREAFSTFNCLDCTNCCKTIGPRLTEKDIDLMARGLKMKPSAFLVKFVKKDEDNDYVFNSQPCPFLLPDNYCMIYENRPKACREYPHTNRKRFLQIIDISHKNCETCPVVFSIFNHLVRMF